MPISQPTYSPTPSPVGRFVLFIVQPGAGYGGQLAASHADDFDDLLPAIPSSVADDGMAVVVVWNILDRMTGRLCASHEGPDGDDAKHPGLPRVAGGEPVVGPLPRYIGFSPNYEAWGYGCAVVASDTRPDTDQILDLDSSILSNAEGRPLQIVPSLASIEAFQAEYAEWLVMQSVDEDDDGGPPLAASDVNAADRSFFAAAKLPDGWEDLPTNELRALVERLEAENRGAES